MSLSRCLALLAVGCLACGCSEPRSNPRPRSQARNLRPVAAQQVARRSDAASSTDVGKVITVSHVAPEKDLAPPVVNIPLLIEEEADLLSDAVAAGGCDEASQVLVEAVKALRTKLTVIGHNLANADTIGFKSSRVTIEDFGYRQVKLPGAQDAFNNYAPSGIAIGHGCRIQSVTIDFGQGPLKETARPLDVAIEGDGFFQVIDPSTNDFLYTRAGNFSINANGLLVVGSSSTGRVVQPRISIPIDTTGVVISAEGNVSIQQFGQQQFSQVGQLQLAKYMNPQGLLALGENLYQETLSSGKAIFGQPGLNGLGTLRQKALERSNVDLGEELAAWKTAERSLQALERLLGAPRR